MTLLNLILLVSTALLLAALLGLHDRVRRLRRAMASARHTFERWAARDFEARMLPADGDALNALASSFNLMAGGLSEHVRMLEQQHQQQEAMFVSMVEGVVALDPEGRVLRLNRAAARLFNLSPEKAVNRTLQELARDPALQAMVAEAFSRDEPVEGDITLFNGARRHLQVHVSRLRNAGGANIGALIVLNDVTRLRRLEDVRRDFVANVSHELKTPITSIKGFIETLQDGALKNEADARRFLDIMARQADRLNAIIEDLLQLSRIEEETGQQAIRREAQPVAAVLQSAFECCRHKAEARQIAVELRCEPGLRASFNAPLLEQAVINLLDNAIKYSPPGSPVRAEAGAEGSDLVLRVRDRGPGIPAEHLPRLFERFYRVDKARSRQMGGTGLGLAIVKHIAQAHGGRAAVESRPGEGSVFSLHLPA